MSEVQIPLGSGTAPETTPRPFLEVTDLWLSVHKMTEVFFAREAGRASGSATFLSILVLSIASAVLSLLASAVQGGFDTSWLPPEYRDLSATVMTQSAGCMLCAGFSATLLGFYLDNVLVYVAARLLGGRGDFTTQAYVQSLYSVPLGVVSALLALVPFVGILATLAVAVLMLVYSVRAVKAAHDITTGKAVAAVLAPLAMLLVFICLALLVAGASILEIIRNLPAGS